LEIHKVINNTDNKNKPKLDITTKSPLCKQIIIFIGSNSAKRVMAQSNIHISNINRSLKGIKLEIIVDFIRSNNKNIIFTTNKATATLDLNIVKEYLENLNDVDSSDLISLRLLYLKLYLKILSITYFIENTNLLLTFDIVEKVIKTTHIVS